MTIENINNRDDYFIARALYKGILIAEFSATRAKAIEQLFQEIIKIENKKRLDTIIF